MGLKILHSADWHLDTPFTGFDEGQRSRLKQNLLALPGNMADICRRERCDLVLLAGDLFDGPATRETVEVLKQALAECAVPVFITPGNHDFCGPDSPWLQERWPENVYVFTGALESVPLPELDCRVWGAGYRGMDCPAYLEGFTARGPEKWQLGVLHGDAGGDSPYCPVTSAQVSGSGLAYLALGHIHKAGSFRAGRTLCAWPGCPMGRGWDETGEKGYYLVTLEEEAQLQWKAYPAIRFREETVNAEPDPKGALEAVLPGGKSEDFFRLTLTGSAEVDIQALLRQFSHIPNLWLRDRTEPPLDLWAGVGEDTLDGVFFRLLQQSSAEAEGREREQILLAAKISRQLLEGREVKLP